MKIFGFVKDKWFYISLVVIILLIIIGFRVVFNYLDKITRHGEEMVVPDFTGLNYDDLQKNYEGIFHFHLIDSVYVKGFPEGSVYQQNPKPGQNVKKGRNMYIIRTSKAPEFVPMPNVRNLSLRQAVVSLNAVGLKVNKLMYVDYFARNAVVNGYVNDKIVNPMTELEKGTGVTLEIGLGNGDKTTFLPDMVGESYSVVREKLINASLNVGVEIFDDSGSRDSMFVCRMEPEYDPSLTVRLGSEVNVWYKSAKSFDVQWYKTEKFRRDSIVDQLRRKKIAGDSIKYVIDSFNYILTHRSFSFDPELRRQDMEMRYERIDASMGKLDSLYLNDDNSKGNYFYEE